MNCFPTVFRHNRSLLCPTWVVSVPSCKSFPELIYWKPQSAALLVWSKPGALPAPQGVQGPAPPGTALQHNPRLCCAWEKSVKLDLSFQVPVSVVPIQLIIVIFTFLWLHTQIFCYIWIVILFSWLLFCWPELPILHRSIFRNESVEKFISDHIP